MEINKQIRFYLINTQTTLCFTHAVVRSLRGEKINTETTDKVVHCNDCFMENIKYVEKANGCNKG